MPVLKPFFAIRPDNDVVTSVASKSTDFDTDAALIQELHDNPNSYLHVTKMPIKYPGRYSDSKDFLSDSREFIQTLILDGILKPSKEIGYCIYRQTIDGTSHTGVIGLCDMEDYRSNHIKRHEFTRHEREEFISALLDTTSVIGEPLLLSHHHKQSLEDLLRFIIQEPAEVEFEKGGRYHQIWQVSDREVIENISNEMDEIQNFYIMDGHHRIASVNNLYEKHKSENYRYALSFVLDANQLSISPFHRLITNLPISHDEILERLSPNFEIIPAGEYVLHPAHQRSFIMKLSSGTYILNNSHSWGGLDVDLLEEKVLKEVFDIQDTRSNQNLQFLAGDDHLNEALEKIKEPDNCLFLLHPCSFREIAMTSDAGQVLPPKSTYVEPKCRAGLFIQSFGDNSLKLA